MKNQDTCLGGRFRGLGFSGGQFFIAEIGGKERRGGAHSFTIFSILPCCFPPFLTFSGVKCGVLENS